MTFSDSAVSFSRQILPLGQETSTKSNHKKFSHLYILRKKRKKKKKKKKKSEPSYSGIDKIADGWPKSCAQNGKKHISNDEYSWFEGLLILSLWSYSIRREGYIYQTWTFIIFFLSEVAPMNLELVFSNSLISTTHHCKSPTYCVDNCSTNTPTEPKIVVYIITIELWRCPDRL